MLLSCRKKYFISKSVIAFSKISYLCWVLFSFPPFYALYCIGRAPLANFIVMPYKSARVRQGKGSVTFPSCVTILNVCLGVCVPRTVLLTLYKLSLSLSLSASARFPCGHQLLRANSCPVTISESDVARHSINV